MIGRLIDRARARGREVLDVPGGLIALGMLAGGVGAQIERVAIIRFLRGRVPEELLAQIEDGKHMGNAPQPDGVSSTEARDH